MNIKVLGIDIAKEIFELHGVDETGETVLKKRLQRAKLAETIAKLPSCLIGLEACGGSHHWARKFSALGHEVRLMNPQFVKPYVKSNKTDSHEARSQNLHWPSEVIKTYCLIIGPDYGVGTLPHKSS